MKSSATKTTDALTVLLHAGMIVTLVVSLATGLRIAADAQEPSWAAALGELWLQGTVSRWHAWAALALSVIVVAYVVFLEHARLGARIALDGARRRALVAPDRRTRWSAINVAIYWLAFIGLLVAVASGALLYFADALLPYASVATVHQFVAWLILAYIVVHVFAQLALGGVHQLLKIFTPRTAYGTAATVAFAIAALGVAGIYLADRSMVRELVVKKTATAPTLDGRTEDWTAIAPVAIHTVRGANLPGGETTVQVRVRHDGERLYALFEWPDATRSQKHLPLVKTAQGWKVAQSAYGNNDENDYYEDKFAVMLARSPELAGAGSSHLGPQPLADKPAVPFARGLHYTTDGSIADVWHWKSVRSGNAAMHQIDDNYFGPPLPAEPGKRYTGGYTQDPKTGGGFRMNWEKYDDDTVKPLRLPKDPALLARLGHVDLDPNKSDDGEFWLALEDTIPYSAEADTYPVGTVLPSVLVEGPFSGDRGDVLAVGRWRDGVWRLEVSRKLDTGSEYDTALKPGEPVYLWVSVFDHLQTRHSQHLHPLRLVME